MMPDDAAVIEKARVLLSR